MSKLADDEKKVLAQALMDYMEGIMRADLSDKDKEWCEDNVSSIERKLLGEAPKPNFATYPYDWAVEYLKDARESEAIDRDTTDAVIKREAYKLEELIFKLASSFVDNEFDESDTDTDERDHNETLPGSDALEDISHKYEQ